MAPRRTKPPSKTKAVFSLPSLIELFILSKQIEGRSPKTLSWYQANLERFSDFVTDGRRCPRCRRSPWTTPGLSLPICKASPLVSGAFLTAINQPSWPAGTGVTAGCPSVMCRD